MPESISNFLVEKYTAQLRRELVIQGMEGKLLKEVLLEAESHLTEAIEVSQPQSGFEVEQVIAQFGSAAGLARRLTQEQERASSKWPFLWPAIFFVVSLAIFNGVDWTFTLFRPAIASKGRFGLNLLGHTFFPTGIWSGSVFLAACAACLFVLGYRARKPMLGQFLAATGVLWLVGTVWYSATSFPLEESGGAGVNWYRPIRRDKYSVELASLRARMETERSIGRALVLGKAVFSSANSPSSVPSAYRYGGQFLVPEGLREVMIGIKPSEINPGLLASSWPAAISHWNSIQQLRLPARSEADELLGFVPMSLAYQQATIDQLKWIHDQPIGVQIPIDIRMAASHTLPEILMAMLITLAGWIVWKLVRFIGTLRRRLKYQSEALAYA